MKDFPITVISLKDSTERREIISRALNSLNLPFSFYDAIDGRKKLPLKYESQIDRELSQRHLGRVMTDAEFGCALSHVGVYNHIVSKNLAGSIVLEDDAIIGSQFRQFVVGEYYRSYKMVFLAHGAAHAYRLTREVLFPGVAVWRCKTNPNRTTGYSIQAEVAKKLLKLMKPIHMPADIWPCEVSSLKAVIAHPSLVGFDDERPSMISSRVDPATLVLARKKKKSKTRFLKLDYWKNKCRQKQMNLIYSYIPCSTREVK